MEQEEVVSEESRCSAGARVTAACSVQSLRPLQNALGEQARGDLEASGLVDDVCDSLDEAGAGESEKDEVENASGVGGDAYGSREEASAVASEESEMEEEPPGVCPILFRALKRVGVQTEEAIRALKEYHEFQQAGNSRS